MVNFNDKKNGSVTVEASFVVFFFLAFFIALISFYSILDFEIHLQSALEQTIDEQAAFAVISTYNDKSNDGKSNDNKNNDNRSKSNNDINSGSKDSGNKNNIKLSYIGCSLDYIYASSRINGILGKEYINNQHVSSGINMLKSRFLKDGEHIELIAEYKVKVPFISALTVNIRQKSRRRIWTGDNSFDNSSSDKAGNNSKEYYITPEGEVYHLYPDCKYIEPKFQRISAAEVKKKRNKEGGIYYACECCKPDNSGYVYISEYGNRYHRSTSCSAIMKNPIKTDESGISNRPLCSKCRKRHEG